jgi:hypothetical protein
MSAPRCGALVLCYRQATWIEPCLRALLAELDTVVVVHSEQPWTAYNPGARARWGGPDGSREILARLQGEHAGLEVIEGDWRAEEPMRDDGLAVLRDRGVELGFIVDADEFHPPGQLARIAAIAAASPRSDRVFWARGLHLFRGLHRLVVGGPPMLLPVAFEIGPRTLFLRGRVPSGTREDLPLELAYWHTGYVDSDARMLEKVQTFGHAHELVPGWFEEKWLAWTPDTRDLCRKRPQRWPRTEAIDPRILPAVLHDHPFFALALAGRCPR